MLAPLFWGCVVLLVYTYFGYPALVGLWARLAPRPLASSSDDRPRVAVIVVARNEAGRIGAKIQTCLAQDYPADRLRVIVASDGSTDATEAIVRAFDPARVTLLAFAAPRGKAACLNDAVAACDEEVLVLTDARQRFDPEAVRHLVSDLADPTVGAVGGELVFEHVDAGGFAGGVDAYWRYETFIRRSQAAVHSSPGVSGALYALRRSCFRPIPANTILDDVAIPMQIVMQGKRVVFDGRARAYDTPSADVRRERLRKVRTLAGNFQLLTLYPQLLLPWRNPIVFQFVSHKVLRLAAPWAMVGALAANLLLAPRAPVYAAMLAAQAAFYALALAGTLIPASGRWIAFRLPATFVALNAFALLGLFEFATNRNAHLWRAGPEVAVERPRT